MNSSTISQGMNNIQEPIEHNENNIAVNKEFYKDFIVVGGTVGRINIEEFKNDLYMESKVFINK